MIECFLASAATFARARPRPGGANRIKITSLRTARLCPHAEVFGAVFPVRNVGEIQHDPITIGTETSLDRVKTPLA